jgi:hypothetical protein
VKRGAENKKGRGLMGNPAVLPAADLRLDRNVVRGNQRVERRAKRLPRLLAPDNKKLV